MRSVRHEDCWAKTTLDGHPGISVEQHGRTAGIIAELLLSEIGEACASALETKSFPILAALHDVGKVSPGFQQQCAAWMSLRGYKPHEMAGLEKDHGKISQTAVFNALKNKSSMRFWAAVVGAHHGKLKGDRLQSRADGGSGWETERQRLIASMIGEFGPLPSHAPASPNSAALWFASGLISVADWLASDEGTFPADRVMSREEIARRARNLVDAIGFRFGPVRKGLRFDQLFPFCANELQQAMVQATQRPGVYVVEASMGAGKTEAALAAAYTMLSEHKARGIYFALPTQATSNRIYERFASYVEQIDPASVPRLLHGASWLNQDLPHVTDRRDGTEWFASSRRGLLAPFGVGTLDQALLGVLAVKHFFVRQYALAGKVVILDEVHSYDMFTGTLVDLLVRKLRELQATVIVLSATLTRARRLELTQHSSISDAYPLISACDNLGFQEISVSPESGKQVAVELMDVEQLPDKALQSAQQGACVLWIRNTVADAQETYRRLNAENRQGGPVVGLLHSRFPYYQREYIERTWMGALDKAGRTRPTGCVLVSTQIAEQSVDIDADLLITDIAPTDMLLQRVGRLWRHERRRPDGCARPEVWIMKPGLDAEALRCASVAGILAAFGKSARIYAPYVLLRTIAIWSDCSTIQLPHGIRDLIEATYRDARDEPDAWRELRERLVMEREKMASKALRQSNPWSVPLDDKEDVQTRWNTCPSARLFLARKVVAWADNAGATLEMMDGSICTMGAYRFDIQTARALHRNLVRVPLWRVAKQVSAQRYAQWAKEYLKGDALLVSLADDRIVTIPDCNPLDLQYRDDLGIIMPDREPRNRCHAITREEEDESYDW